MDPGVVACRASGIYVWQTNRRHRLNESALSGNWKDAADRASVSATFHDARRAVSTQIAMLTQSTEPANHVLPGVTSRYVAYDFGDIKANALQLWADKQEGLLF